VWTANGEKIEPVLRLNFVYSFKSIEMVGAGMGTGEKMLLKAPRGTGHSIPRGYHEARCK